MGKRARWKMVSPSWLLVAVMAHMCLPSWGSECWDSSVCSNLSNEKRILECIQMCMSVIQSENPQLGTAALNVNDGELPLSILQTTLASDDRILESKQSHSDERRSYSMEHFRWGKPSGRKRRPVKVFASSLEGGGSTEGSFPPQARRQLNVYEEKRNSNAPQELKSKTYSSLSPQERKDGTYRMSHFRWGSPPASKRNGSFMKLWEEKPQSPLVKLLRNIMGKDMERIMG